MSEFVETTAFLTLQASRSRYGMTNERTGLKPVSGLKALRITQGRPMNLSVDEIGVKVRLRLPAAVFDPIEPSAVITIPEDAVFRGDIVVEAVVEPESQE